MTRPGFKITDYRLPTHCRPGFRLRSTWRYECFKVFFDWLICKILSSDWSIECFEAFVASSGPQPDTDFISCDLFFVAELVYSSCT